jgi:hypothetical protein
MLKELEEGFPQLLPAQSYFLHLPQSLIIDSSAWTQKGFVSPAPCTQKCLLLVLQWQMLGQV